MLLLVYMLSKKIYRVFLLLSYFLATVFGLLFRPTYVYAGVCPDKPENFDCLNTIFSKILGIAVSGASMVFFVMIISGGIKWLTSAGDPKDIENAQGRITFALLGFGLMILSWLILKFIKEFTGTNVLFFDVPS
ncbi:hypothetical protein HY030_02460 [Candidatus Gottesmanbacteria bacterium]|nr:hypothetical protein [Candidatus Gottesmanbacteria bacterium]